MRDFLIKNGSAGSVLFSLDEKYRYVLTRRFYEGDKIMPKAVNFIMLNPSTADQDSNDPTVERCSVRARQMGFDILTVTNLFAFRSTNPKALKVVDDPVGKDNDYHLIHQAYMGASLVVAAWGNASPLVKDRASVVVKLLKDNGVRLHYLKISESSGQPWHPLYLSYDLKPIEWSDNNVTVQ